MTEPKIGRRHDRHYQPVVRVKYYGTDVATFRLLPDGRLDIIFHETGRLLRTTREALPSDAVPLSAALVEGLEWPKEEELP